MPLHFPSPFLDILDWIRYLLAHYVLFVPMRSFAALLLVCLLTTSARAQQAYDLVPEKWYPLERGNAWYYEDVENCGLWMTYGWINRVVADTVVNNRRWARIQTVWVSQSLPCPPGDDAWWSFTPDHFLVRTIGSGHTPSGRLDTLHKTQRSVFTANREYEELPKRDRYDCPISRAFTFATVQPFYDQRLPISTNTQGNAQDSTNFSLVINNDGHASDYMCDGYYIYKIGSAQALKGAIVNGIRWGEANLIEQALPTDDIRPNEAFDVLLSPNPSRGRLNLRINAAARGNYSLRLYDLTGRVVFEHSRIERGSTDLDFESLPTGGYLLRLTASDGNAVNRLLFVLQ